MARCSSTGNPLVWIDGWLDFLDCRWRCDDLAPKRKAMSMVATGQQL